MGELIEMYGRETCEDTMLARDRLNRLAVPVAEHDVEQDAEAARQVEAWNGGNRSTPTFRVGGTRVVGEPQMHELDGLVAGAGYDVAPPRVRDVPGRPSAGPPAALPTPAGAVLSPAELRDRRVAVFFAGTAECLACRGYARALLKTIDGAGASERHAYAVLAAGLADAERWLHGEAELPADGVAADASAAWSGAIAALSGAAGAEVPATAAGAAPAITAATAATPPTGESHAALLALLEDGRLASVSAAPDAGGLVTPFDAAGWVVSGPGLGGEGARAGANERSDSESA